MHPSIRRACLNFLVLSSITAFARAAPVTEKTPNVSSPETTAAGTGDFLFTHRFFAPGNKVLNSPTFTLDAGLFRGFSAGLQYASSSDLDGRVNEFQPLLMLELIRQRTGSVLDVSAIAAYNTSATSFDGAIVLRRRIDFVSLSAIARIFSDGYDVAGFTFAAGGGLQIHLNRFLQLQGDLNKVITAHHEDVIDLIADKFGWSGAVAFEIPYTPHSLSLYVTNVNTVTLQGASRGSENVRYGFEFDVPLTNLSRWVALVHPPKEPAAPSAPPPPAAPSAPSSQPAVPNAPGPQPVTPSAPVVPNEAPKPSGATHPTEQAPTVDVPMENDEFKPGTVTVAAGATVRWINRDKVQHNSTSDTGAWESGTIAPGASYSHRFDAPGRYPYTCTIHPFMRGTIVVTPAHPGAAP
jgi:plastocyanin